jgi:multiple sugar transport system permease protein
MLAYKNRAMGLAMIVPIMALLIGVIVIPELWAIILSLTNYKPTGSVEFIGVENYTKILGDPYFFNSLVNTLQFIVGGVALQMVVGTAYALLLSRQFRFQKLWIALILAPSAMSPAILGTAWKYLFNADFGPINYALYQAGIEPPYWFTNATFAFIATLIVYTWHSIPQVIIFVYPAIISIPPDYHEAAAIDGASRLQTLWRITLPLISPALLVALVFRTIVAVRVFAEIYVLTKGGPFRATEVLALYLYKEGFTYFSWGSAAAVGWLMLLITMVIALPQIRLLIRQMYEG